MDRSQIFIWMMSLCFSIAPFWSVSAEMGDEAMAEAEAAVLEAQDMLDTALASLSEEVQDELGYKRYVIEAIDMSLEVNDALGLDGSSGFDRFLALPVWVLESRLISGMQGPIRLPVEAGEQRKGWLRLFRRGEHLGLTSDLRRVTHDQRMVTGDAHTQLRGLVKDLLAKEAGLKSAQDRLSELQAQQAQESSKASGDAEKPAQAEAKTGQATAEQTAKTEKSGGVSGDADKPAQAEAKTGQATAEQTAKTEKSGGVSGDADKPAQAEAKTSQATAEKPAQAKEAKSLAETRQEGKRRRRARGGQAQKVTVPVEELIRSQQVIVQNLQTEVSALKKGIVNNMNLKLGKAWYRIGRFARGVGLTVIVIGGLSAQAVIAGNTVIVFFDFADDMEMLKEQYVQDIEEVMSRAIEEASASS
ncbi:MAG: hypothetical protein OXK80_01340 [Bdellovibrionales bacterium]|nr:hypothetical protein [Bdellovibrionales bacterium]